MTTSATSTSPTAPVDGPHTMTIPHSVPRQMRMALVRRMQAMRHSLRSLVAHEPSRSLLSLTLAVAVGGIILRSTDIDGTRRTVATSPMDVRPLRPAMPASAPVRTIAVPADADRRAVASWRGAPRVLYLVNTLAAADEVHTAALEADAIRATLGESPWDYRVLVVDSADAAAHAAQVIAAEQGAAVSANRPAVVISDPRPAPAALAARP